MGFCAGGTIFTLVHQRTVMSLRWSQRLKIALDEAKGMNFLHRRQVIHRDLKSLNLLLAAHVSGPADTPSVKISDFGLSRALSEQPSQACMTSGAGTYHWMAPEVLDGQFYDEKVDVYSYGVLLYELICRRIPFDGSGLEPASIPSLLARAVGQTWPWRRRTVRATCVSQWSVVGRSVPRAGLVSTPSTRL